MDPFLPAATCTTIYLVCSVARQVRADRDRRWIRKAFSSYISPKLVEYLIDHQEELKPGGTRRRCSFVCTDLADFTSLVETADPEEAVALLNEYLDRMTAIAPEHEGTLDRIVGDAVAVMFAAPVSQPDHAARAVRCALAMDAFAQEFAERKRREGVAIGLTRIGVNTWAPRGLRRRKWRRTSTAPVASGTVARTAALPSSGRQGSCSTSGGEAATAALAAAIHRPSGKANRMTGGIGRSI